MAISRRRLILTVSSVILLFFIVLSLATAIELTRRSKNVIHSDIGHAKGINIIGQGAAAKANLDGIGLGRLDGLHMTSILSVEPGVPTGTTKTEENRIGSKLTSIPQPSATWNTKAAPDSVPAPLPPPQVPSQGLQIPIMALTFSGDGGPKHCRGALLQRKSFPPPLAQWKNGTCINIPGEARCGVFFAGKGDNCEAHLFNMPDCYNSSRTYVNTVVFMPEERPVGGVWNSMLVKCGVEVPPAKILDPSILGDALKKKPNGG